MSLAHFGLTGLVVLVDANDSQVDGSPSEVMTLEPIPAKLAAFGLDVREVDGHDPGAVAGAVAVAPPAVLGWWCAGPRSVAASLRSGTVTTCTSFVSVPMR